MTAEPALTARGARVDPGGVKSAAVVGVALGTLVVMALGIGAAWVIESEGTRASDGPPAARFGAPPEVLNGIEMSLFERGAATRHAAPGSGAPASAPSAAAEQRLRSYGWQDRARGVVFIPIARAIELYLERERLAQGPGRAAPPEVAPHPDSKGAP